VVSLCKRLARLEQGHSIVIDRPAGEPLFALLERMCLAGFGDPNAQFNTAPWFNAMTHDELKDLSECLAGSLTASMADRAAEHDSPVPGSEAVVDLAP
jgi:hypothetical protein